MVPSSMDRDVMSDMSCRGYDMDNLDHAVGNALANYRDEISVWNGGVGVDDGSWSLPLIKLKRLHQSDSEKKIKRELFPWRACSDRQAPLSSLFSSFFSASSIKL